MSTCEICKKEYETYPIFVSNNTINLSKFITYELKPDGTFRTICEKCREKEDKVKQK